MNKRKYGQGSIIFRRSGPHSGRWEARLCVVLVDGTRARRSFIAHSKEDAEGGLALLRAEYQRGARIPKVNIRPAGPQVNYEGRRYRFVRAVIAEAEARSWAPEFTAHVVLASLSPERVARQIFGPCVYCGSWLAATVDHVHPRSLGGGNEPENLVSACRSCNSAKSDTPIAEWQRSA